MIPLEQLFAVLGILFSTALLGLAVVVLGFLAMVSLGKRR